LQLDGLEHSQIIGGGVWQAYHMAKAIVLLGADHTSQQAEPTQALVLWGGIGLIRHLVVVITIRQVVIIVIVVFNVVANTVKVHAIAITRTSLGCAQGTSGTSQSTTTV
jgi:hypothetical protein